MDEAGEFDGERDGMTRRQVVRAIGAGGGP